jgi:hypothetical protein
MQHPTTWLEVMQRTLESETVINAQIKNPTFTLHTRPYQGTSQSTTPNHPLKVQILSPTEMTYHQSRRLYYNYDEKYALGHSLKNINLLLLLCLTLTLPKDDCTSSHAP